MKQMPKGQEARDIIMEESRRLMMEFRKQNPLPKNAKELDAYLDRQNCYINARLPKEFAEYDIED